MKHLFTLLLSLLFGFLKAQIILPNTVICEPFNCVGFADQTPGAIAWAWNFGDPASGPNNFSTQQFTSHCYPVGVATYTVTCAVTTNVTTLYDTAIFQFVPTPVASFTSVNTGGNTVQFTDQSTGGVVAWQWDFGDFTSPSSSQNPTHTYASSSTFTVSLAVVDTNGCMDTAVVPVTTTLTGIAAGGGDFAAALFPNPASNSLTIDLPVSNEPAIVELSNAMGEVLLRRREAGARISIDVSSLMPGVYFVQVWQNGKKMQQQLVIAR